MSSEVHVMTQEQARWVACQPCQGWGKVETIDRGWRRRQNCEACAGAGGHFEFPCWLCETHGREHESPCDHSKAA
jgi:DnaJ-class molecular chaperone